MYNLFFRRLFRVKGRSSRKEYIARILLTFLIFFVSSYINDWKQEEYHLSLVCGCILVICMFISLIQYFPLSVRRLHDLNESGWYVFLTFIPFCQFFILWLMFKKGTPGTNRYGEPPEKLNMNQGK
jgi:uncharacterized membrane protein YhaH (DUF805 family)